MPFRPSAHWPTKWKSLICNTEANVADVFNKSSVIFFFVITEVAKKNSVLVLVQDTIITWHAKKAQINYSTWRNFTWTSSPSS